MSRKFWGEFRTEVVIRTGNSKRTVKVRVVNVTNLMKSG